MVITMSTPVKTSLKMFWTLWESSLSRPRPSQGTETLFTLCSTHQSLMCFLFVIKLKKKKILSSSCVTVHSPGFLFCGLTFSTPYLSLNVTAIPAPYAQSALTQCAKGFLWWAWKNITFSVDYLWYPVWDWTVGVFTHTWVITLHMSYHLRSYSHPWKNITFSVDYLWYPVWDWTVGVFTHTWVITLHMSYHLRSYSHPPSLGPESSGPLQFAPKPARGVTCNTRRQMIPGVAFSC